MEIMAPRMGIVGAVTSRPGQRDDAGAGPSSHPDFEALDLAARVSAVEAELVDLRRDLHAHPELSWAEVRTTLILKERLTAAGLSPQVLPGGTAFQSDAGLRPNRNIPL